MTSMLQRNKYPFLFSKYFLCLFTPNFDFPKEFQCFSLFFQPNRLNRCNCPSFLFPLFVRQRPNLLNFLVIFCLDSNKWVGLLDSKCAAIFKLKTGEINYRNLAWNNINRLSTGFSMEYFLSISFVNILQYNILNHSL